MLPYIVAIGLIAILAVLVNIALDMREVRRLLSAKVALPDRVRSHNTPLGAIQVAAFSVWTYKKDQWILVQECGQAGCDCGPAPNRTGRFEGEVVRKECSAPVTP
jgi:hypothetical protein